MLKRMTAIATILFALGLMSCGGDSATAPEEDTGGGTTNVTISLPVTSAMPGEEVDIEGIPTDLDLIGTYAVVTDVADGAVSGSSASSSAASPATSTAFVGRHADGTPYVVAPLKPTEFTNGGPVTIQLAGEGVSSNTVSFTVDPLPPATVTVSDMVDQLQGLLSTWLAVHGTTREELRAMDPATMPAVFYPLWQAHEMLDSPDNPNSMRAAVDGPVPFFDNEVIDFDVTDRMLSQTGVVGFLGDEIVSIDSLIVPGGARVFSFGQRGPAMRLGAEGAAGCNIPAGDYGISTASQLETAMEQARAAAHRIEGFTGDVLDKWSNTATAAGVYPPLKGGATVVSAGLYVFKLVNEAAAKLLPTSFDYGATDFDVAGDDYEYNEDDTGGYWENFRVTAVSQGWVLDEDILKAILKLAKFKDLGGTNAPLGHLSELENNLKGFAITQGTKAVIGAATDGSSILEVCPGTWPDIDVGLATDLSEATIAFGTSFKMNGRTFFEAKEPGVSQLKLQTTPGRFGGVPPASKTKSIKVIGIVVDVTPGSVTMEPSEIQTFDAMVQNASDDRVDWKVPPPLIEVSRTNNGKTIVIQAPPPEANWNTPVSLIARSLAETGARKNKVTSDPREGGAVVAPNARRIVVSPRADCIGNGETRQFTAVVTGVTDPVVHWVVDTGYGTINETTGLYKAPSSGTTDDIIVATVVGEEDLRDYANIRVGSCECYYDISVGGASSWHVGGSSGYYTVFGVAESGIIQWQFVLPFGPGGEPIDGNFAASIFGDTDSPMPVPGDVGQYEISAVYVAPDNTQSWNSVQGDPDARLVLDIIEYTSTFMEGTMSGIAVQRNDPNDSNKVTSTVFINVSFRTGLWAGGRFPCE